MTNTIEENVARGIVWMNENLGADWPDFIDRETFNLDSNTQCILGLTFGNCILAEDAFGGIEWARELGFFPDGAARIRSADLQAEWESYLDAYEDGLVSPS